ncbi:transglycosylase domain-containing protein [Demequina muriae]|uniref:Transglycosylase domain-containing protein n=1 Tax=Demequina muriae TaxID=3051664 RepID=A0ABT8GGY1_9MICO|nr:transglycosylase domain-containing protein [Demequina sp. EGI L300058]MDN4480689.1 transglycosylase domain-containing protein [Demequina sp. EGI L300058]
MGILSSSRARRDGQVTLVQLLAALLMFIAFSVIGGFLIAGIALPVATVAGSAANGSAELFEDLPDDLANPRLPQQSNIYARDGKTLLATFYSQNRVVVPLEEISPWMQKAVVAIEDKRFWAHNGVDGEGIVAAAYRNLTTPENPGASTLTQQLVKNTLYQAALNEDDEEAQEQALAEATEVSMARKIREWRLALAFEENLNNQLGTDCTGEDPAVDCGKEEVLQQYLNIAQFGSNIYGVEAAAQYYFSKPAAELTALEAATIAGITQNPTKWDPTRTFVGEDGEVDNFENAEIRRDNVLGEMFEQGMITEAEFDEWEAIPVADTLNVSQPKFSCAAAEDAPFFCDYVTKIIRFDEVFNAEGQSGYDLLLTGGLNIVTTLDVKRQRIANQELRNTLPADDPSGFAMAMVALDPENGEVLAMAQNREFDPAAEAENSTSINYSVDRKMGGSRGFSPGSTFKPVILAEWLNTGHSLRQFVSGTKREWEGDDWTASCLGDGPLYSGTWEPGNVGGTGAGQMSVLQATANSVNTAYVAMSSQLDLCDIGTMAERLGYERADGQPYEPVPSSVLGPQNASPLTMAEVMQTFANEGIHCEPIAILSITQPDGTEVPVPQEDCRQAIDADVANGVTYALQEVMTDGSGRFTQLDGRPSAGKTGTSQENAHTWFAGYTPQLVSVFWLGHPDRDVPQQNMTIGGRWEPYFYGSTLAAPTWEAFMERALDGREVLGFPEVSSDMLNGVPVRVPDVRGRSEGSARFMANDAGFLFRVSEQLVFSNEYEAGTVAAQSPSAGSTMTPGGTMTVYVATDTYPDWWYNWPDGWDRNTAPDDYWGSSWPPAEFESNPPNGWERQCTGDDTFNEDTDKPCPGYDEDGNPVGGGNGGGGNNGGGNGGGNNDDDDD